jgi:hypothetical protein
MVVMNVKLICVVLVCLGVVPGAWGHSFGITEMKMTLDGDGGFEVVVRPYSLDSIILDIPEGAPKEEGYQKFLARPEAEQAEIIEKVGEYFRTSVIVAFDDAPVELTIGYLDQGMEVEEGAVPIMLGEQFVLRGQVREGAKLMTLTPLAEPYEIVMMLVLENGDIVYEDFIPSGVPSTPFIVNPEDVGTVLAPVAPRRRAHVMGQYVELGYVHIVPKGLDHILFVLGLFLLSAQLKPLLWQITAFTLAHTVTLALATTMDEVVLSASIVEPLIALSIVYVAVENCRTEELSKWRPAVVFGFGLLHGLGFAGVLQELGLPEGRFFSSLISFNVGVELGQLSVVLVAFLVLGWFRNKDWYRSRVTIPASVVVALIAGYWTVERIFFG